MDGRSASPAREQVKRGRETGEAASNKRRQTEAEVEKKRKREEEYGRGGDGPMSVLPPSPTAVQRLVNACRALLHGVEIAPRPNVVSVIRRILDGIGPEDVALTSEVRFFNKMNAAGLQNPPIITCKNIYESHIAVFFLPAATTVMPLHDHPGMTVFSKLLVGSARVTSYDWIHPAIRSSPGDHSMMLAKKVLDHELTAASGTWVLYPVAGGNMHRFVAGEEGACAFLDVLTPPYSTSQRRVCNFYRDFPYDLYPNVIGWKLSEQQKSRLAWLQRIGTPEGLRICTEARRCSRLHARYVLSRACVQV